MIKYIGSKRTLLPVLVELLQGFPELTSVVDLFAGTSRVGHAFKGAGLRVVANDHNAYAHCLARCYVEADRADVEAEVQRILAELAALPGKPGYFTDTFCVQSRFFQPHNGERIDAMREAITRMSLPPVLEAVVLTSLMEASDRVDSTCGLQMAYVKQWAPRSFKDLELRMPDVLPAVPHGRCEALRLDANDAVAGVQTDIAYVDPPYNQHSYLSNYHIWETLVQWDKPEVYGVAKKRVDCRTRKSAYNSKRTHRDVFADLVRKIRSPLIVVSFNNEGYQSRNELEALLSERGEVFVVTKDFKRYVGAQIGVYNPSSDKVGNISHLRNEEYIYLVATPALRQRVPDARERLGRLAARVGDETGPREDRVATLLSSCVPDEAATRAELQTRTGLSEYQTRMAIEAAVARGLLEVQGTSRRKVYRLAR